MKEGDDEWFWPAGRGRATLGQRLAWTVTDATSINTTLGTEHTERVEQKPFQGCIAPFASDKQKGALEAKRHINGPGEMSF